MEGPEMGGELEGLSTRTQQMARCAYQRVEERRGEGFDEYQTFVKSFPTLIHSSGLAQALAYANSKNDHGKRVVKDLAEVLSLSKSNLEDAALESDAPTYLRLSQQALEAGTWLKRYADVLERGSP